MSILEEAIAFATKAHSGQERKTHTPYILHPMEVASIVATMTTDVEVMAAGVLHDTVEDCNVSPEEIRRLFGQRVYELVMSETEDKHPDRPAEETWMERKQDSLQVLKDSDDTAVKILWLSDKLSNMRSLYKEYLEFGNSIWERFHQTDPQKQEWYYRTIAEYVSDLKDMAVYQEYVGLLEMLFKGDANGTCKREN